jgi:hypothetical protein
MPAPSPIVLGAPIAIASAMPDPPPPTRSSAHASFMPSQDCKKCAKYPSEIEGTQLLLFREIFQIFPNHPAYFPPPISSELDFHSPLPKKFSSLFSSKKLP